MLNTLEDISMVVHIEGLVQQKRNSSALAIDLRLSCSHPSLCLMLQLINVSYHYIVSSVFSAEMAPLRKILRDDESGHVGMMKRYVMMNFK